MTRPKKPCHPIYAQMLKGVYQAVRYFSFLFFLCLVSPLCVYVCVRVCVCVCVCLQSGYGLGRLPSKLSILHISSTYTISSFKSEGDSTLMCTQNLLGCVWHGLSNNKLEQLKSCKTREIPYTCRSLITISAGIGDLPCFTTF